MGGGGPSCGHNAVVDDPIAVLRQCHPNESWI